MGGKRANGNGKSDAFNISEIIVKIFKNFIKNLFLSHNEL